MYGRPLVISEAQGFDSAAVLSILPRLIRAWTTVPKYYHPLSRPLTLALRTGHDSLHAAAIEGLRADSFRLSGWADVSDARQEISRIIAKPNAQVSVALAPCRDRMESLSFLIEYFDGAPQRRRPMRKHKTGLRALLRRVAKVNDQDIYQTEIKRVLKEVAAARIDLDRRTPVFEEVERRVSGSSARATKEVVSYLYNNAMANFCGASGQLGTIGPWAPNEVVLADSTAQVAHSATSGLFNAGAAPSAIVEMADLDALQFVHEVTFGEIAEFVTDDAWIASIERVRSATSGAERNWEIDRHTDTVIVPFLRHKLWGIRHVEGAITVALNNKKTLLIGAVFAAMGKEGFQVYSGQASGQDAAAYSLGLAGGATVLGLSAEWLRQQAPDLTTVFNGFVGNRLRRVTRAWSSPE